MTKDNGGPAVNGWMPIETAPKDLTILVFVPDSAICEVAVAHCASDDPDGDWYNTFTLGYPIDIPPTHWMPLPSPPKEPTP